MVPKESVELCRAPAGKALNDEELVKVNSGKGLGYVLWYYCTDCGKSCEGGFRGGHFFAPNKTEVVYRLIDINGNVTTETEEKDSELDGTKPSATAKGFLKYELDGSATTCFDSSRVIVSEKRKYWVPRRKM